MVYLNEWLPDPPGVDTAGEFIELYNSGAASASLNGWSLVADGKKRFSLKGAVVPARGYLVLTHAQTKLSLRNGDGGLALYDPAGAEVDGAAFTGAAPVGKSYSRVNYVAADVMHFAFTEPTPDALNAAVATVVAVRAYPLGTPLVRPLDTSGFFAIMMGTAALLAGLAAYVVKSHPDLSQLFFGRNEEPW